MYNFFSFFYTHKYHKYNSTTFGDWVLLNTKHYQSKPTQANETQLSLVCYTSNSVNEINIDIDKASIYADCSYPITGDKDISCSSVYFPGSYKLTNLNTSDSKSLTNTKYITLDDQIIQNYPYFNSTLNINYQNIFISKQEININKIDIFSVPYGVRTVKKYSVNQLESVVIDSPLNEAILPNYILNKDINHIYKTNINLYDWSLSLLALIESKEDILIYKSLLYIKDLLYRCKLHTQLEGLPNDLNNSLDIYSLERSVFNNAWAGFCILQAIGYFSNSPLSLIKQLPADIKSVLNSIVLLIKNNININYLNSGYDVYGGQIQDLNVSATYISDIFLNQYLCYFYDFGVSTISNNIHTFCVESIYTDYSNLDYYTNSLLNICTYKINWVFYFNRDLDLIEPLFNQVKDFIDSPLFNPFDKTLDYNFDLLCFIYTKYKTESLISINIPSLNFTDFYYKYNSFFVRQDRKNSDEFLYLVDSSWGVLNNVNSNLLNPVNYNIDSDSIELHTQDLLKSLVDSWPTGSKWTSFISIYDPSTTIGSLLLSTAAITKDWNLLRQHVINSLSCNTSQGNALDKWGSLLNYYRPQFQADYYYKETLLLLLNKSKPNKANLQSFVEQLLEDSLIKLTIKSFPKLYYKNLSNSWVYKNWEGTLEDINLIKSQLNSDNEYCFYLPDLNNNMTLVPVHNYTGQIDLFSNNIDTFSSELISRYPIAGVTLNISKIILLEESKIKDTDNFISIII